VNPDFNIYQLPEEHQELRAAVRSLSEKEIAPHAADVDDKPRYPTEARTALTASGFHAVHLPEEYGGDGADAIAGCIVIEEVARVCASSSLIPGINKLGSMPGAVAGLAATPAQEPSPILKENAAEFIKNLQPFKDRKLDVG